MLFELSVYSSFLKNLLSSFHTYTINDFKLWCNFVKGDRATIQNKVKKKFTIKTEITKQNHPPADIL